MFYIFDYLNSRSRRHFAMTCQENLKLMNVWAQQRPLQTNEIFKREIIFNKFLNFEIIDQVHFYTGYTKYDERAYIVFGFCNFCYEYGKNCYLICPVLVNATVNHCLGLPACLKCCNNLPVTGQFYCICCKGYAQYSDLFLDEHPLSKNKKIISAFNEMNEKRN